MEGREGEGRKRKGGCLTFTGGGIEGPGYMHFLGAHVEQFLPLSPASNVSFSVAVVC